MNHSQTQLSTRSAVQCTHDYLSPTGAINDDPDKEQTMRQMYRLYPFATLAMLFAVTFTSTPAQAATYDLTGTLITLTPTLMLEAQEASADVTDQPVGEKSSWGRIKVVYRGNQPVPYTLERAQESQAGIRKPGAGITAVGQYNSYPSSWKFPFRGSSKITTFYGGAMCAGGTNSYHTGNEHYAVDWSRAAGDADRGDPVLAPASSWVTFAGWKSGYGNCIIGQAGNGYSYLIAHLDRIDLNYCGWVERGQQLGTLGCTGSCVGAHIHFVVYRNGVSVPQNGISGQGNLGLCGTYGSGQ